MINLEDIPVLGKGIKTLLKDICFLTLENRKTICTSLGPIKKEIAMCGGVGQCLMA